MVAWVITAALVVSACGSAGSVAEPAPLETKRTTTTAAAVTTVTTAATDPPVTQPPSTTSTTTTTTTIAAPETTVAAGVPEGELPIAANYLVYGADGIVAVTDTGEMRRISSRTTGVAIGIGDAVVVAQGGGGGDGVRPWPLGPITVYEPGGERELALPRSEQIHLYDAGMMDGRAVALASIVEGFGWDAEEHLLLIDVATGEHTDLGVVGYYEAGIQGARLAADAIVIKPSRQEHFLEARAPDGTILWSITGPDDFDNAPRLVVVADTILLVNPGFVGNDFTPTLNITSLDLGTGVHLATETVTIGAEFGGGFCLIPDWDGTRLVCEESYGGPFTVDLATGSVSTLTTLDTGIASAVRRVDGGF